MRELARNAGISQTTVVQFKAGRPHQSSTPEAIVAAKVRPIAVEDVGEGNGLNPRLERAYLLQFAGRPRLTNKRRAMIDAAELGAAFLRGELVADCDRDTIAEAVRIIVDELDRIDGDCDFEDAFDCDLELGCDAEPDERRLPRAPRWCGASFVSVGCSADQLRRSKGMTASRTYA